MKKVLKAVMLVIVLVISANLLNAQSPSYDRVWKSIPSLPLVITKNMTTNLIFPYNVQSVDRGNKDILVQKAKGAENILQVKAAREGFERTNLSVITENGHLYSFLLSYNESVSLLNIEIVKDSLLSVDGQSTANSPGGENRTDRTEAVANKIAGLKNDPHGLSDHSFGIRLYLRRLLIDEDVMYYKILLQNRTAINYDIDKLSFFIRDKRTAKRTASQELEQQPLMIWGNHSKIRGKTKEVIIVALPKFTIPDKKLLYLQVIEKSGGRHLRLKISNKHLIRAQPVNSIK